MFVVAGLPVSEEAHCHVRLGGIHKRRQECDGSLGGHLAEEVLEEEVVRGSRHSRDPCYTPLARMVDGGHRSNHLVGPAAEEDRPKIGDQIAAAKAEGTVEVDRAEAGGREEGSH